MTLGRYTLYVTIVARVYDHGTRREEIVRESSVFRSRVKRFWTKRGAEKYALGLRRQFWYPDHNGTRTLADTEVVKDP